jgi:hypothetical protein
MEYEYWTNGVSVYRANTDPYTATQVWHQGEWQSTRFIPQLAPIGGDTDTHRITEAEADQLRADSPNV